MNTAPQYAPHPLALEMGRAVLEDVLEDALEGDRLRDVAGAALEDASPAVRDRLERCTVWTIARALRVARSDQDVYGMLRVALRILDGAVREQCGARSRLLERCARVLAR